MDKKSLNKEVSENLFIFTCSFPNPLHNQPRSSINVYQYTFHNSSRFSDHVSWKDEVEDSPTGEYSVQSTLTITGATVEDTGLYQCIANNDHQNIVDTASIFISCKFTKAKLLLLCRCVVQGFSLHFMPFKSTVVSMPSQKIWLNFFSQLCLSLKQLTSSPLLQCMLRTPRVELYDAGLKVPQCLTLTGSTFPPFISLACLSREL